MSLFLTIFLVHSSVHTILALHQGSSCFKAFALALLPACDVHLLRICLTCFLTSTQSLFKCYFLVTTFWFNLTTQSPLPPISTLCSDFLLHFFTIALTTMRYAKYFSFLKIVYLVFINMSSVQWIALSVLFKVQSQPLDLCLCHKYLWNGSFLVLKENQLNVKDENSDKCL